MSGFLHRINYASSNEDGRSECAALRLGPRDVVLCITGSGARPLDLLTQGPARVISVDINPCQNHLLQLKTAAIQALSHAELLAFLGVTPSARRVATYHLLRRRLPDPVRRFWDRREAMIARGVIYAGRWERHFRLLARLVGAAREEQRRRLFACTTCEEQAAYWNTAWEGPAWRAFLRLVGARWVWQYILRDPGFYRHVADSAAVAAYLGACLSRATRSILFRESDFATLLFFGAYGQDGPLPWHLRPEHYPALRQYAGRVQPVTGDVAAVLAQTEERFSAYSLSDVASYTDQETYALLWQRLVRTAAPGARVCERQFLVKRTPPLTVPPVRRDRRMEDALGGSDHSIFYSFVVGSIPPNAHA